MTAIRVGSTVSFVKDTAARKAPAGSFILKNGKRWGQPKGARLKVTALKRSKDGRLWAKGRTYWYAAAHLAISSPKPATPVPGYGCNYPFGVKNSGYAAGYHTGADFAAPTGTKIVAVTDGTITRTDWGGAYGNWTWLKSTNGRTYVYCHQSARHVTTGDHVKAGQVIGEVGSTGNVSGPHCHFEATRPGEPWVYGKQVNPVGTWT